MDSQITPITWPCAMVQLPNEYPWQISVVWPIAVISSLPQYPAGTNVAVSTTLHLN